MFEESLYNLEPAEPTHEGDFLHNYELKNWDIGPRVYKIIVASALVNILLITIAGQGSVLTAKTCDSPLVGRVCQVLDTVYVGSMLFGTQREYVDVAYEKTDLSDADITFIDVSGAEPPLTYPAGYFQLANPEQFAMQQDMASNFIAPGIPSNPMDGGLINQTPVIPKANPNPIQGELPAEFSTGGDSSIATTRKGRRGGRINPTPDDSTTASTNTNANTAGNPTVDPNAANSQNSNVAASQDEAKEDQFGVYINKRPLKDKATDTILQVNDKKVKLDSSFKVVITGTLGLAKDGKTVVLKNPKPVVDKKVPNDPVMVKFVQDWILAVSDAGWLGYLDRFDDKKKIKSRKVVITVEQNDTDFVANIRSEMPSENEAKTAASGLGGWISIGAAAAQGDNLIFLKSATTTSEANMVVLNVNIPKPVVQEMIQRKLEEAKAAATQPNSTAIVGQDNNSAAK